MQATGRKPAIKEPGAWLAKAVRAGFAPPKGYEPKAERDRQRAEAERDRQRADAERQALAGASDTYREHIRRGTGPLAEVSRRLVIEEAVLRVCPKGS